MTPLDPRDGADPRMGLLLAVIVSLVTIAAVAAVWHFGIAPR